MIKILDKIREILIDLFSFPRLVPVKIKKKK